jgi:hypothetical protein
VEALQLRWRPARQSHGDWPSKRPNQAPTQSGRAHSRALGSAARSLRRVVRPSSRSHLRVLSVVCMHAYRLHSEDDGYTRHQRRSPSAMQITLMSQLGHEQTVRSSTPTVRISPRPATKVSGDCGPHS